MPDPKQTLEGLTQTLVAIDADHVLALALRILADRLSRYADQTDTPIDDIAIEVIHDALQRQIKERN